MRLLNYARTTGVLFLIIAVLHLLRIVYRWPAAIGGWSVPMWLSVVALVVAAYLGVTGLRARA